MTHRPIASVLLPFRDAERTLAMALQSILDQRWRDFELVAVDDGSRDGSAGVVQAFAQVDERVKLVSGSGGGLVDALNEGLAHVRGDWVARMDADDWSYPERFAAQYALATQTGAAVVACQVEPGPEDVITPGMRHYLSWSNALTSSEAIARDMFVESPIVHPTAWIRAELLRALGGYRRGPFPEDYDLWLRIHRAGGRFAKVDRVLVQWRDSARRLTRTDARYGADAFRALKAEHVRAWLDAREPKCGERSPRVTIWGAGPDGRAWVPALDATGVHVECFFDVDPKKVGNRVRDRIAVLHWEDVDRHRGTPLLAAVGVKGVRASIRGALDARGWVEGRDYLAVQ